MKHINKFNESNVIYPKGYVRHYDRKSCDTCIFFEYNTNKPKQERKMVCKKVTPELEVYSDDVCDEYTHE